MADKRERIKPQLIDLKNKILETYVSPSGKGARIMCPKAWAGMLVKVQVIGDGFSEEIKRAEREAERLAKEKKDKEREEKEREKRFNQFKAPL